jgi:hypothetical protein
MIWGCRIDEHSNLLAGYAWPSDTPSGRIRPASELTRNMRVRLGASETATFSGRILLFGMTSAGAVLSQSAAPPFADTFQSMVWSLSRGVLARRSAGAVDVDPARGVCREPAGTDEYLLRPRRCSLSFRRRQDSFWIRLATTIDCASSL